MTDFILRPSRIALSALVCVAMLMLSACTGLDTARSAFTSTRTKVKNLEVSAFQETVKTADTLAPVQREALEALATRATGNDEVTVRNFLKDFNAEVEDVRAMRARFRSEILPLKNKYPAR